MKLARLVAVVGLLATGGAIVYALVAGNFSQEGRQLLSMPWGIVSLVDLYSGFALFSGWIIYREKSLLRAGGWVILLMTLGFFTGCLYTLLALAHSEGDWEQFWLGARRQNG